MNDRIKQRIDTAEFLAHVTALPDDAIILDALNGTIVRWTDGAEHVYGYTADDMIGRPISMLVPPDRPEEVQLILQRISRGERIDRFDTVQQRKDGSLVEVSLTISPIRLTDGTIAGASLIARDVSTRSQAELDLSFQGPLLMALSAVMLDAILVVSENDEVRFMNAQFVEMWRLPKAIAACGSIAEYRRAIAGMLVDPEGFFARATHLYHHPGEESRDTVKLKDGRILDRHSGPIVGADGTYTGRVWFYRDITDHWQLSEGLRQSETNLAVAQRVARLGSWSWDLRAMTLAWSDETFRVFGYSPHEIVPTLDWFMNQIHPADRERVGTAINASVKRHQPYDIEFRILHPEGGQRAIHARGEVVLDGDGNPQQLAGTVLDITDLKLAEDALRESEELLRAASESGIDAFQILRAVRDETEALIDFEFVHLNRRAEVFLRRSIQDTIGRRVSMLFPAYVETGEFAAYAQVIESGVPLEDEYEDQTPGFEGSWVYRQIARVGDGVAITTREITWRKRAEESLRESEERFRGAFDNAAVGIAMRRLDGQLIRANSRLCNMLGYDEQTILESQFARFSPDTDVLGEAELREQLIADEIQSFQVEKVIPHRDGRLLTMAVHASIIRDANGQPAYLAAQILDITEQRRAERALSESEERFRRSFSDAAIGMALVGLDGAWLQANPALCHMLGYTSDELAGLTFQAVTHPDDLDTDLDYVRQLLTGSVDTYQMEKRYIHRNGHVLWALLNVSLVRDLDAKPVHFISQIQDISERKALQEQLQHQAFHDSLTGLPNRAGFHDRLQRSLARVARGRTRLALIYLDLDGFKLVNDTLGHAAGDALLARVAKRMTACVRPSDVVARLGGDEFAILLEDIDSAADAVSVAARLIADVSKPFTIGGTPTRVGTSIGVTVALSITNPDTVQQQADSALYAAKAAGKGRFVVFGEH